MVVVRVGGGSDEGAGRGEEEGSGVDERLDGIANDYLDRITFAQWASRSLDDSVRLRGEMVALRQEVDAAYKALRNGNLETARKMLLAVLESWPAS